MYKTKVYDLPTRIFHWLFAVLFLSSYFIASEVDDDSTLYIYHMIVGFLMVFLLVLRTFWGFVGTKHSKFSSFRLRPSELVQYLSTVLSSKSKRYLGHNPASSYAVLGMFVFTFMLVLTGILMSKGIFKDISEEIHELCADGFIITVALHIAGVVLHHLKHKDGILFSMLNGTKKSIEGEEGGASNRPLVAIVFLILVVSFGIYLNQNYDSNTKKINLFGTHLELGDGENEYSEKKESSYGGFEDEDDDDDDDD